MLIDEHGVAKGILERGEHKSIQKDRVTLVPGPAEEIAVVQEIFHRFVDDRKSETEIAEVLNACGILTDLGRVWTRSTIHQILIIEKYIGNNVWNRSSFKLKKRRMQNDPETWVRAEGAFEGIVDPDLFAAANTIINARSSKLTDDEMLKGLKEVFEAHGFLSGWSSMKPRPCLQAACIDHDLGVCFAPIGWSGSSQIGTIGISRSIGACAISILTSTQIESRFGEVAP